LSNANPDITLIKLDSTLINFKKDLFLAMVYVSLESPSCSETDIEMVYAQLMEDV
jgi:hypothetical protein